MNNEKKIYEPAEIKIVELDRDMLIESGGDLTDDSQWGSIGFDEF